MEALPKQIAVGVDTKLNIPIDELNEIQGELKEMSDANFHRCRKTLLKNGIKFASHVWKEERALDDGRKSIAWYLIDGHGRKKVLVQMREKEGFEIPLIPCVEVFAPSYAEAKRLVLDSSSSFHTMTPEGLYQFSSEMGIGHEELEDYYFSEVDHKEYVKEFYEEAPGEDKEEHTVPPEMQYLVVVECQSERDQERTFSELTGRGYACKLMS